MSDENNENPFMDEHGRHYFFDTGLWQYPERPNNRPDKGSIGSDTPLLIPLIFYLIVIISTATYIASQIGLFDLFLNK